MKHFLPFLLCFFAACGSLLVKGDEALQQGNLDQAAKEYTAVINDKSTPSDEMKAAQGRMSQIYYSKGLKEYDAKKFAEALEFFEKSAEYADQAGYNHIDGLDEKTADSYFQLGEKEYAANNAAGAKKYFAPVTKKFAGKYSKYPDALFRMFFISLGENDEMSALGYLGELRKADPKYVFDAKANDAFNRILSKLTRDADAEFKKKNYDAASQIVEKASVLPNFDEFKQKQFKARIVFIQGKDLITEGKVDEGLAKLAKSKEIDLNIATEINNFVNADFVRASKDMQRKRQYKEAVDKLLIAQRIAPDNKDLVGTILPDAYYEYANSLFNARDYKGTLVAMKAGLALNKEHKNIKYLWTRWDQTANSVKLATSKEFPQVVAYVDEQYRNAVASEMVLGQYKNRRIKWQFKVVGTDNIGGKSYGKFLFDKTIVYGLPTASLDAQRFASGCEDAKDKQEAVVEGTIGYVEELLGIRYIVLNVNTVKFAEPLE